VTERRRIEIAAPEISGSKQPYPTAERLRLQEAEQFLLRCNRSSTSLARKSIGDCINDANRKGVKIVRGGILLGSGRPLGTLAAILASHALIHTAEGEFFRSVVLDACKYHEVQVVAVKEKELLRACENELRTSQGALDKHLSSIGRRLGPPWQQDEKFATMVAWLALAASASGR
jgi:hypothetical protein